MFKRAPGFFDVVAYSGNGQNRMINHNLEVIPEMYICKERNGTGPWYAYHKALGNGFTVEVIAFILSCIP